MQVKISDSVPKHVAQFLRAILELQHLQSAHIQHLAAQHKSDTFPDSETVFTRAGITLLCSAWEAYVEDLARNGITLLIEGCNNPADLPLEVRKNIAKAIKQDKNELSPWTLAGNDWRNVMMARFETAIAKEANSLNSPKSQKIKAIYAEMLGIEDITECWSWEMFDKATVQQLIDHLVEIRGSIAHGRTSSQPAQTLRLIYLHAITCQCVALMNNYVCERLHKITGKTPWALVRFNQDWTKFTTSIEAQDSVGMISTFNQ